MALQRGLQKASKLLAAEVKVRARGEQSTRSISNHHSLAFIRRTWQAVAKPVESDDDIMNIAMIATGSEGARTSMLQRIRELADAFLLSRQEWVAPLHRASSVSVPTVRRWSRMAR